MTSSQRTITTFWPAQRTTQWDSERTTNNHQEEHAASDVSTHGQQGPWSFGHQRWVVMQLQESRTQKRPAGTELRRNPTVEKLLGHDGAEAPHHVPAGVDDNLFLEHGAVSTTQGERSARMPAVSPCERREWPGGHGRHGRDKRPGDRPVARRCASAKPPQRTDHATTAGTHSNRSSTGWKKDAPGNLRQHGCDDGSSGGCFVRRDPRRSQGCWVGQGCERREAGGHLVGRTTRGQPCWWRRVVGRPG